MSKRTLLMLAAIALILIGMTVVFRSRSTEPNKLAAVPVETTNSAPSAPPPTPSPTTFGAAGDGAANPVASASREQAPAECKACRSQQCTNFRGLGVDLLSGCFRAVDPSQGADTMDQTFLDDCVAAVRCAARTHCAEAPTGTAACYCGKQSVDDCVAHGPASDAPCAEEWRRAARTREHGEIGRRFSDFKYPSGWASAMIDCDQTECKGKCSG